jgi:hypothetical protein
MRMQWRSHQFWGEVLVSIGRRSCALLAVVGYASEWRGGVTADQIYRQRGQRGERVQY